MTRCRVCDSQALERVYAADAPALTSLAGTLRIPTRVFVCRECGHGQSDDLPNTEDFYDHEYKISLSSADHDQLCLRADGTPAFRTDVQADLVLSHLQIPHGGLVLDYGAGKATTLRKVHARRPDVVPHVFDMSRDYKQHWQSWIPPDNQATYTLPGHWEHRFDAVTAHFVLEHVTNPKAMLATIRGLLKPEGRLFLSVPDPASNPADIVAVDHVNHFTGSSLELCLTLAGFEDIALDRDGFGGAFVATARPGAAMHTAKDGVRDSVLLLTKAAQFWATADARLRAAASERRDRPSAIYGAGVYGSYIFSRIAETANVECFVDRNPHVRAEPRMGRPVVAPDELPPGVTVVYAGVNPSIARSTLSDVSEWRGRTVELIYLD